MVCRERAPEREEWRPASYPVYLLEIILESSHPDPAEKVKDGRVSRVEKEEEVDGGGERESRSPSWEEAAG